MNSGSMAAAAPTAEPPLADVLSPVVAFLKQPTLVDYPGHLAVVCFLSGCNFRCGYCHNAALLAAPRAGLPWDRLERLGLEYRFIAEFLEGKIRTGNDLFQKLYAAICQFAKRQNTWFRRMERNGAKIHWIPEARLELAREIVKHRFAQRGGGFRPSSRRRDPHD